MTDLPGRENDPNENPFAMFGDPEQMAQAMRQFADMLSAPQGSGPVNWDMAKNIARHAVVAEGDPERHGRRATPDRRRPAAGRPVAQRGHRAAQRRVRPTGVEPRPSGSRTRSRCGASSPTRSPRAWSRP